MKKVSQKWKQKKQWDPVAQIVLLGQNTLTLFFLFQKSKLDNEY